MTKKFTLLLVTMVSMVMFALMAQAQYDLANFDTTVNAGASVYIEDLAVTQVNPTFGSSSNFIYEFTVKQLMAISSRFVVNVANANPTANLAARINRLNAAGNVIQSSRWRSYDEITGAAYGLAQQSTIADLFNPVNIFEQVTGLKLIIPTDWTLFPGDGIQIEIAGARTPSLFQLWSTPCRTAFAAVPVSTTVISDALCCGEFSISAVTGAITDLLGLFSNGNIDAPVAATTCPNYGTTAASYSPPNCTSDPSLWSADEKTLCCQYDSYINTDSCLSYRCLVDWTADLCCDFTPPDNVDPINASCPICSKGNFDTTICCDKYDTANPQYLWNYQNDSRCDAVFCQCEDWSVDRCCFKYEKNNFFYEHNGKCPTCTDPEDPTDWNSALCCQLSEWWAKPICACTAENYNKDICCGTSNHSPVQCAVVDITPDPTLPPVEPCPECDCGCDCECDCDDEEEPSCPCDFFDGTAEGATNTYVKVDKHELDVSDIHSGHNTVVINHLHIDTHIDLQNAADVALLRDLLPSALLSINSGACTGSNPLDPLGLVTNISNAVQGQIDQVTKEVQKVATDVTAAVGTVVSSTQDALNGTVGQISNLIPGMGNGNGANTAANVVRQTITSPRRLGPVELVLTQTLALVGGLSGSNFKWVSQNPITVSGSNNAQAAATGYQLTYEISSKKLTASQLEQQANAGTASFVAALNSQFNTSGFAVTSPKSVSASNECVPGTCTASCQCDLFYACSSDEQCLSNTCKDGKCYDTVLGNSAVSASVSMLFVAMAVVAMLW